MAQPVLRIVIDKMDGEVQEVYHELGDARVEVVILDRDVFPGERQVAMILDGALGIPMRVDALEDRVYVNTIFEATTEFEEKMSHE